MIDLYGTGIRPYITEHLDKLAAEERNYGEYWSASSAGHCMRRQIFERLKVPYTVEEIEDARKQRIFSAGHVFHEWIQRITEGAGISIAQELELQDETLMVRGHCDDIVLLNDHLILYDYKSAHSDSFHKSQNRPMSYYHRMQVSTYLYMLRQIQAYSKLEEARVMKISKDDLVLQEHQLIYTPEQEEEVVDYWMTLNQYWDSKEMPDCTCHVKENGFFAYQKYNPYFYNNQPCSIDWY